MAKTRSEIAPAIILFAHGLLVFVPAAYFSCALFFKCVTYVYYGVDRAWSESITAEPLGKAWIRFSTGEITSYGATDALSLSTILLLVLPFLALAATLFYPVFQVTQLCLAKVASSIAKKLDVCSRPNVQQNARERVIHADEPARRKRVLTLKPKSIEAAALIVWLTLWVALFFVTLARTTDINLGTIVVGLVLAGFRSLVAFFVGIYAPVHIVYTLASRARRSKPEARVEIASMLVLWFVASCYLCFSVVPKLREGERPRDVEIQQAHSQTFSEVPGSREGGDGVMDLPWGNGIAAYLGLVAVIIVAIVLGGRIAVQGYRKAPPPLWAILYGVFLFFALIVFNGWWFMTRH